MIVFRGPWLVWVEINIQALFLANFLGFMQTSSGKCSAPPALQASPVGSCIPPHPWQLGGTFWTSSTCSHSCRTLCSFPLTSALWDSAPFPPWPVISSIFTPLFEMTLDVDCLKRHSEDDECECVCLFSELLPSGWQLKSKLFMAFSLFQATKELELDKLGTSQHRFALCKDIMKSLNLPTVLVEVRWQRAECVYQGINVLNLKLSSKYKIYSH